MPDGLIVAALVVVNPLGDVIDPATGKVVAGVRNRRRRRLRRRARPAARRARRAVARGDNSTIGVVATNAKLTKAQASYARADGRRRLRAGDLADSHAWSTATPSSRSRPAREAGRAGHADARRAGGRRHGRRPSIRAATQATGLPESAGGPRSGHRPGTDAAMSRRPRVDRREFLRATGALGLSRVLRVGPALHGAPGIAGPTGRAGDRRRAGLRARRRRSASPPATFERGRAIVWSRADRPARMFVEYSTTERFADAAARAAARRRSRPADFTVAHRADRSSRRASGSSTACSSRTSPTCARGASRCTGSFTTPSPRRRATSRSPGRPTRSGRAGASTRTGAGCGSTTRCGRRSPTSSSTSATPSTPTSPLLPEVKLDDGPSGRTW